MDMEKQTKKHLKELDKTAKTVEKSVNALNDIIEKTKITGQLMFAKLKREKLRSLAAIAQHQAMMVDLELQITQNELKLQLCQLKAADSGPMSKIQFEWSAPACASAIAESNEWLASRLRDVNAQEEQFHRMLEDRSTADAPPLNTDGLSQEQSDAINGLYKDLMAAKEIKIEPDADVHSNASAETLILCHKCDAAESRHVCPT